MKKLLLVILGSVISSTISAQLHEKDSLSFGYKATSTGALQTGNVERLTIISGLELSRTTDKISWRMANSHLYQSFFKNKADNNLVSRNFIYHGFQKKLYPYLMGWAENNFRRKIDFRYQVGPGATYRLFEKKKKQLIKVSFTATYESTEFAANRFENYADTTSNTISTYRGSFRLYGYHQLIKNKLQLLYEFWWQQSLEDSDNYRWHYDISLNIPVSKLFSFRSSLNYSYENIIPNGIKNSDLYWTFGLAFGNL